MRKGLQDDIIKWQNRINSKLARVEQGFLNKQIVIWSLEHEEELAKVLQVEWFWKKEMDTRKEVDGYRLKKVSG